MSLRVIGVDGSNDRELVPANPPVVWLWGWTRSSNALLLLTRRDDAFCAELFEVATGHRQELRCWSGWVSEFVSISPDDRYLAYTKSRHAGGPTEDIAIFDRITGNDREVAVHAALDRTPVWTPDGRAIAFVSNRLGTWGLFTVGVEDGIPQGTPELVRDLGRSMPTLLGFTRDGTLFARMLTDLEDVLRTQPDFSVPALGAPSRADPTALDESCRSPAWSPDGQRFAYLAGAWRGEARILIAHADGRIDKALSFPPETSRFGDVRWAPDGRVLAVTAGAGGPEPASTIDLIDLATGRRRTLVRVPSRTSDFHWSPDGQRIYVLSRADHQSAAALHAVDVATGVTHLLYQPQRPWVLERFSTFGISRDGLTFAVAVRKAGVKCAARIVTASGAERDLPPFPADCRAIAWAPDGQSVLASVHEPDGSIPLYMVSVHGDSEPARVQSARIQVVDIAVSPDGRELLLGTGNPRPDFWTIRGFTAGVE